MIEMLEHNDEGINLDVVNEKSPSIVEGGNTKYAEIKRIRKKRER